MCALSGTVTHKANGNSSNLRVRLPGLHCLEDALCGLGQHGLEAGVQNGPAQVVEVVARVVLAVLSPDLSGH